MKIVFKVFLYVYVLLNLNFFAFGQRADDQRTLTTKMVDLLAVVPAKDPKQLEEIMSEMAGLGREGLIELAGMMTAIGQGDNTNLEYALAGYTFHVTQNGMESLRAEAVQAYCTALDRAKEDEVKAFLIRQLQIIGNEDAIPCLSHYLGDERLCGPAARSLVSIGAIGSGEVLREAMLNSSGNCLESILAALGDLRYLGALREISSLANNPSSNVRKLSLYALANLADPSSDRQLKNAVEKANYTYSEDNATGAYITYINRLNEAGNIKKAEKLAKDLMKMSKKHGHTHTRSAGLNLIVDIQKENSMKLLIAAAGERDPAYRAAALNAAIPHISAGNISMWTGKFNSFDPHALVDIIAMLGETGSPESLPAIIGALSHNDVDVRAAAIRSAGKLGNSEILPRFMDILHSGARLETQAVTQAIRTMDGEGITDRIVEVLGEMPPSIQSELIEILGSKAASNHFYEVFSYIQSDNREVSNAAFASLENIAEEKHLPHLYELLNSQEDTDRINMVQKAIISGIGDYDNNNLKQELHRQMSGVSDENKIKYFNILASLGGKEGSSAVADAYRTGNSATKSAALQALSIWADFSAAEELYRIAGETTTSEHKNVALKGYIMAVSQSEFPSDQKILFFKKAMKVANSTDLKALIIRETGKSKTFPALVFAGKYLDDNDVNQEAALTVMNISLADKNLYGPFVRDLLETTITKLKGPDSEYQIEAIKKHLAEMPTNGGFEPLFNGSDLNGWKGVVTNPIERQKMSTQVLAKAQTGADEKMRQSWKVENGVLFFQGKGDNIGTEKKYGDFELFVDWKILDDGHKEGDGGIYLRGTPQVQIWDISREDVGAQVGSGGLYNNTIHKSTPLKVADNPLGEWNNFRILMTGDRVTVYLNGEQVTDNVILENYWDRSIPIFSKEQIELQAHGSRVAYRDIFIKEIPRPEPYVLDSKEKEEGFELLFDGTNMHQWQGNTTDYIIENGEMVVHKPKFGSGGNLFTKEEYSDFVFRFEFKLTPGANNGLGIRAPLEGDAAYQGMEIQILDNDAEIYKNLKEHQYHGSVYGIIPAKRGYLKPVGEWNIQEVRVKGPHIQVILNGTTILDGNLEEASRNGTLDGRDHPGLNRKKGHIGFLGHGSTVWFRNIRVRKLD